MKVELIAELSGHAAPVYAIHADGELLYSASSDRMLASWSMHLNEPNPFSVKAESGIYCFSISASFLILGCSSGNVHVIDLAAKKEIKNFKVHKKGVY